MILRWSWWKLIIGCFCLALKLLQSVGFVGNGYLELPASLLRYDNMDGEPAVIALAFHTTSDGVLLYQREAIVSPSYGDFILLRSKYVFLYFPTWASTTWSPNKCPINYVYFLYGTIYLLQLIFFLLYKLDHHWNYILIFYLYVGYYIRQHIWLLHFSTVLAYKFCTFMRGKRICLFQLITAGWC